MIVHNIGVLVKLNYVDFTYCYFEYYCRSKLSTDSLRNFVLGFLYSINGTTFFMKPRWEGTPENWHAECSRNLTLEGLEANDAKVGTDRSEYENYYIFIKCYFPELESEKI